MGMWWGDEMDGPECFPIRKNVMEISGKNFKEKFE
jgi:hypothetical protein